MRLVARHTACGDGSIAQVDDLRPFPCAGGGVVHVCEPQEGQRPQIRVRVRVGVRVRVRVRVRGVFCSEMLRRTEGAACHRSRCLVGCDLGAAARTEEAVLVVRLGADGLWAAWKACETGAGSHEEEHSGRRWRCSPDSGDTCSIALPTKNRVGVLQL